MPVENLLTPDTLRRIAWQPPADISPEWIASALGALGARPWQIEATAQTISEAFVSGSQDAVEPEDAAS
jgi:ribonuclease D